MLLCENNYYENLHSHLSPVPVLTIITLAALSLEKTSCLISVSRFSSKSFIDFALLDKMSTLVARFLHRRYIPEKKHFQSIHFGWRFRYLSSYCTGSLQLPPDENGLVKCSDSHCD